MSGWIKMSVELLSHPKVVRMSAALKADKLRIIGGLWAVWCVFDAHSGDGLLEGYTLEAMDAHLGWKGFAATMHGVGWLESSESGLHAPRFSEHNGATAKRRAMETSRKGAARKSSASKPDDCPPTDGRESGHMSASDADKLRNREEKRREEREIPPKPPAQPSASLLRFPPGFEELWSVYPRKIGKDAAARAYAKRKPDKALAEAMVAAVRQQRDSADWRKDGGQFIPHLSTWLNAGRWQDETDRSQSSVDAVFGAAR